jgi:hypothetical protein
VPTIEIDRVRRQGPDGSLYVTADDAALPGAAALTGFAATPDIAGASVQAALTDSHRNLLTGSQTVLTLAVTVLPTATDTFTIAGEVFELVDMAGVPPVVSFAGNIGIPLAAGAGALEATRLNIMAALNGTAVDQGIEDGGLPAAFNAAASTFLAFRDPLTPEIIRLAWADAAGGRPIHIDGDPTAAFGALAETFADPGNVWLKGETDISDGFMCKVGDARAVSAAAIAALPAPTSSAGNFIVPVTTVDFVGAPVQTFITADPEYAAYFPVAAHLYCAAPEVGTDLHMHLILEAGGITHAHGWKTGVAGGDAALVPVLGTGFALVNGGITITGALLAGGVFSNAGHTCHMVLHFSRA